MFFNNQVLNTCTNTSQCNQGINNNILSHHTTEWWWVSIWGVTAPFS